MKSKKRNKCKRLLQRLLLAFSIPQFNLAQDMNLLTQLNAYVNANGILNTQQLPTDIVDALHGLIESNKIDTILPKAKVQTADINSGSSIICTPFIDDFDSTTLTPTKVKRSMSGIAGNLAITHEGMTNYKTIDNKGKIVKI